MLHATEAAKIAAARQALEAKTNAKDVSYVKRHVEPKIREACEAGRNDLEMLDPLKANGGAVAVLIALGYKASITSEPGFGTTIGRLRISW